MILYLCLENYWTALKSVGIRCTRVLDTVAYFPNYLLHPLMPAKTGNSRYIAVEIIGQAMEYRLLVRKVSCVYYWNMMGD